MKVAIVLVVAVLAVAFAKPLEHTVESQAKILRANFDQQPDGPFQTGFETDNGIVRSEEGVLKTVKDADGKDLVVLVSSGTYSYPDVDGKIITLTWRADENGFQAQGEHIPKV